MPINQQAVLAFIIVFSLQTLRKHQFQWFWFAVILWLAMGILSAQILPNILGITHWTNAYLVHFYAFLGSIFFFINDVKYVQSTDGKGHYWQSQKAGVFLTLFAVSGLIMHLAFGVLSWFIWWQYPSIHTMNAYTNALFLYIFNPILWYGLQSLLMTLLFLHRWITGEAYTLFSLKQIQINFLICLILIFLYVVNFYPLLPLIIQHFDKFILYIFHTYIQ